MLPHTDPANTGREYAGRKKRTETQYHWRHSDGREAKLSPFELAEAYGLRANDVSSVARGEHSMCFGWSIVGRKPGWPCGRLHFRDERSHSLTHEDGRTASGDQGELRRLTGMAQQDVSALVTQDRRSAHGWMLSSVAATGYKPRGWRQRAKRATADVYGPQTPLNVG